MKSIVKLSTMSTLVMVVGLTTIGCTNATVSNVQASPQSKSQESIAPTVSKSNEKEPIAPAEQISLENADNTPEPVMVDRIEDGRYWIGYTGQGLEVDGKRYRYDTESGSQPWKKIADLKYVRNGVVFDGKNHWCLSTLAPKNEVSSCSVEGWKVSKADVPLTPSPKVAVAPNRQETQIETADYPEISEGMSYVTFRRAAADKGWKPDRSAQCSANVNPGSDLCEQLPELQSCDKYFCQMVFNRGRFRKLITLKVYGGNNDENALGRDSKWRVISWSIDDDNSQP